MKVLRALSVVLTCLAVTDVSAGIAPTSGPAAPRSASVQAVEALMNRCLPGVAAARPAVSAGLQPLSGPAVREALHGREGHVWTNRDTDYLLVDFTDAPQCRIVALQIDPRVFGDLVLRVFAEAETPFIRERFKINADGTFAAIFRYAGRRGTVVIRIATAIGPAGERFATLTVEGQRPDALGGVTR